MKQYLVQIKSDDEVINSSLMKSNEIISRQDATDYTYETLQVYDISEFGKVKPLKIFGCWHDPKNPLYIKVVDENGNVVFDGYGTDH